MYVLQHCCITVITVNEITNKYIYKKNKIKEWNYCKELGTIKVYIYIFFIYPRKSKYDGSNR